jgi:hypothetical protein
MVEHRDVPVHQASDLDQRQRIRPGAEHEQARRQLDRHHEKCCVVRFDCPRRSLTD